MEPDRRAQVDVVLQRVVGVGIALGIDAAAALFLVVGVYLIGPYLVLAVALFPVLQFAILGPTIVLADTFRPELARGLMYGGVAVFGLWMLVPIFVLLLPLFALLAPLFP